MSSPNKLYEAFRVYKSVYSELLDEQYDLFPKLDGEFVDYGIFIRSLADSKLAEGIIVKSEERQEKVRRKVLALRNQTEASE